MNTMLRRCIHLHLLIKKRNGLNTQLQVYDYLTSLVNPASSEMKYEFWIDSSEDEKCFTIEAESRTLHEYDCTQHTSDDSSVVRKPLCQLGNNLTC